MGLCEVSLTLSPPDAAVRVSLQPGCGRGHGGPGRDPGPACVVGAPVLPLVHVPSSPQVVNGHVGSQHCSPPGTVVRIQWGAVHRHLEPGTYERACVFVVVTDTLSQVSCYAPVTSAFLCDWRSCKRSEEMCSMFAPLSAFHSFPHCSKIEPESSWSKSFECNLSSFTLQLFSLLYLV